MKYLIKTALIILGLAGAVSINGQDTDYNKTLKISPIQFGRSFFEIGLEFNMNGGKNSLQISPMALLKKNSFEEFKGFQMEVQYRSYLKKLSKEDTRLWIFSDIDFFAGGYMLGLTYQEDYLVVYYDPERNMEIREGFRQDILAVEGGVFVGVKFILGQRVTLDLLAGGGVRYSDITDTIDQAVGLPPYYYYNDNTNDVFDLGYYGVKPRLNLQLGITL